MTALGESEPTPPLGPTGALIAPGLRHTYDPSATNQLLFWDVDSCIVEDGSIFIPGVLPSLQGSLDTFLSEALFSCLAWVLKASCCPSMKRFPT